MAIQIPFPLPSTGNALNSKVRVNLDFLVDKFNEFNSGTATWDNVSVGTPNSLTGTVTFYNASNAFYLTLKAGVTAANTTYTLPTALPVSTGLLQSDSSGTLSWATTLTGQLIFSTGSLATPSIRAADNLDTGLNYLTATSELALVYNAAKFFSKDATGVELIVPDNNSVGGKIVFSPGGYVSYMTNPHGVEAIITGSSAGSAKYKQFLGTSNQVIVSFNTNDVTLTTPQDIGTSSNVQFGSIRTGAGSVTACALRLNAANTGIFMNSATEMYFAIAGNTYVAMDTSGNLFATGGEIRGNDVRALRHLKVSGSSAGTITIDAPSSFTDYTLVMPSDDGTSNQVLTTNGTGTLSWQSVGGAGAATTALDNLASVAINTSLLSDADNTDDLGSASKQWKKGWFGTSVIVSGAHSAFGVANTTEYIGVRFTCNFTAVQPGFPVDFIAGLDIDPTIVSAAGFTNYITYVNVAGFGITTQASQTVTVVCSDRLAEPQITVGSGGTVTTAATLYIENAPTEGTKNAAIYVNSGQVWLAPTSNQMVWGTTRTVTFNVPTPATTSRIITFPDLSADYSVVGTAGTQTIGGIKTFSANVTISKTTPVMLITAGAGTTASYTHFITNSENFFVGVEDSDGGEILAGSTGYALVMATESSRPIQFGTANTLALTIGTNQDVYTVAFTDYSSTSTVVGWSSFTTKRLYYKKIGKLVFVEFQFNGTSDSTSTSFTLPFTPSSNITFRIAAKASDNGVSLATPASGTVTLSSTTVSFSSDYASAGWTASGTKSLNGQFFYEAA